jgi:hypothetical protein
MQLRTRHRAESRRAGTEKGVNAVHPGVVRMNGRGVLTCLLPVTSSVDHLKSADPAGGTLYRKIRVLLNREGWKVSRYLAYRLYREEGLYYGRATAVGAEPTGLDLRFPLRWPQVFGVPHHQRNRENSRSHRFGCWRHCSQSQ